MGELAHLSSVKIPRRVSGVLLYRDTQDPSMAFVLLSRWGDLSDSVLVEPVMF